MSQARRRGAVMFLLGALAAIPAVAAGQLGGTQMRPGSGGLTRVATRGAVFLEMGVGARSLALSGATTASTTDLSAMYWNVASLADLEFSTAFLSREQMFGNSGLTNSYLGAAVPLFGGALGLSLTSFSSGEMNRTTEEWPEGDDPTAGSSLEWSAMSVGVHYARPFTDRLAFGLTGKYASEGIQFATADYYGVDVGVRFRSGLFGTTLGATIANLGSSGQMDGPAIKRRFPPDRDPTFPTQRTLEGEISPGTYQMPTMLRLGIRTDLVGGTEAIFGDAFGGWHRVIAFADIHDGVDTEVMPAIAAEYALRERLFLRMGYRSLNDGRGADGGGLSLGGGIAIPIGSRRFLVDYAWRDSGELQSNQVFSFQFGN